MFYKNLFKNFKIAKMITNSKYHKMILSLKHLHLTTFA